MLSYTLRLYKQAYNGLSPNSWYLSLVMLINRSGTMVVPFMSIYCIRELHFSIVQAGTIMALFGLGAISGVFVGGKITDKIGFYDLQVGSLLTGGLFFIILSFQHTFLNMGIGIFILSFCNESFRPANATAIAHYSAVENRTRSYSLNRLAANLGWAVGGGLGGLIASFNYHLLFWVDGCTNIFAALLLLKILTRSKPVKHKTENTDEIKTSSAYKDKVFVIFVILTTLFSICFFQFFIMQPVFYKIQWHFNERFIGFLLALNGILIVLIEMVLIHNLEGRKNPLVYIGLGVLISGSGFALLNLVPHTSLSAIIIVCIITLGEMLSMPFMNTFWITRTNNFNRGEYAALYGMCWSAAQIIAPAAGSHIIEFGGFNLLWWVLGGVCLLSATGYLIIYKFTKPTAIGYKTT